ncbi:MAG: hypothetical protein DME12_19570 [Candidatus Rokuibacteriota bacterium]|nr:MAG: hypothetical protein DME12_19570 [Candidatus Rokubacteria bacterium]
MTPTGTLQTVSRRDFLKTTAASLGGALAPRVFVPHLAHAARHQIVVCSWGGSYQDSQREAFFKPFEKETGIRVVDTSQPDVAKMKAMVDSGNVEWDVVTTGLATVYQLQAQGDYFHPLDYNMIDPKALNGVHASQRDRYGLGTIYYSMNISFRTDVYPKGKHPRSMPEFWDVKKFPGGRTLANVSGLFMTLEHGLLADGVPFDKIYPIDIDRAFASLDRVKPQVVKWWSPGALPIQMLADKEVNLAIAYSGRIQKIREEGVSVDLEWNHGTISSDFWVIPRGTKNFEGAMKFVAFCMRPDRQAHLTRLIHYGPTNQDAFQFIPAERAALLPSAPQNFEKMLLADVKWWAQHRPEVIKRFDAWILK